jgi:hypothetical protein
VAGQEERGLAQGLGRQRAGVDRRAARLRLLLHHHHALVEVGRLGGALLAGRARADDDEIAIASHRAAA